MTIASKIQNLIKESTVETLTIQLKETLGNFKLASMNIAIQEELELRIGEDAVDEIINSVK